MSAPADTVADPASDATALDTSRPGDQTPSGAPALQARQLYRFFRAGDEETLALRGVSLEIRSGELLAVVGPSGSGKSTLLGCLAGLDEPDGGSVWLSGRRLSHRPEAERARMRADRLGVLLQSGNLIGHLTVRGNVRLGQSFARGRRQSVARIIEDMGLTGRSSAYPSQLSGGEATRAGLAVALANDPAVLLADEPTGEVDGETEQMLLQLLKDRARAGGAVVVVTHSTAVIALADRVVELHDGRILP